MSYFWSPGDAFLSRFLNGCDASAPAWNLSTRCFRRMRLWYVSNSQFFRCTSLTMSHRRIRRLSRGYYNHNVLHRPTQLFSALLSPTTHEIRLCMRRLAARPDPLDRIRQQQSDYRGVHAALPCPIYPLLFDSATVLEPFFDEGEHCVAVMQLLQPELDVAVVMHLWSVYVHKSARFLALLTLSYRLQSLSYCMLERVTIPRLDAFVVVMPRLQPEPSVHAIQCRMICLKGFTKSGSFAVGRVSEHRYRQKALVHSCVCSHTFCIRLFPLAEDSYMAIIPHYYFPKTDFPDSPLGPCLSSPIAKV